MGVESGTTLRDLIRLNQLRPLERATAAVLRAGDRVLYVDPSIGLDQAIDRIREQVRLVLIQTSPINGGLAVQAPESLNVVGLENLPQSISDSHLPRSKGGTPICFYFMPPDGPVSEWICRAPSAEKDGVATHRGLAAESSGDFGNPKLKKLLKSCEVLPYDVLELLYGWLNKKETTLTPLRASVDISNVGKEAQNFFEALVTQLKILGVDGVMDSKTHEQHLSPHPALRDLLRVACSVMEERGVGYGYGPNQLQVSAVLQRVPQQTRGRLVLTPGR